MIIKHNILNCFFALLITISFFACNKESDPDSQPPVITVYPSLAGNGEIITIRAIGLFANQTNPTITINGIQLTVANIYADSVKVRIPKMVGSGKLDIAVAGKTFPGPDFTYKYKATVSTIAGSGGVGTKDGAGTIASFNCPWGVTADNNGDLYVADCYNRLIRKITAGTNVVTTIPIPVLIGSDNFYSPYNITIDTKTKDLYVTDFNQHVMKVASTGRQTVIYNGIMPTTGIALGANGFLYVSNNTNGTIMKLSTDGSDKSTFSAGLTTPRNIIFDKSNNMYVAAYNLATKTSGIYQVDNSGKATFLQADQAFGGWEIAIDERGIFYEADHFSNVIKLIEKNGNIVTIAGNGVAADVDGIGLNTSFDGPQGLTIDASGTLYVTTYNYEKKTGNKVRKIIIE